MNIERVNSLGEEIQEVIAASPHGAPNVEAVGRIFRLANEAIRASGWHGYISETVGSIKTFAAILYSRSKHRQYDERDQNGADRVRSYLYAYAFRLAQWSPHLDLQLKGDPSER